MFQSINGQAVPRFFYGTAWKEEQTEQLTKLAIEKGFRAIDTANQRKHYHEAGVGRALQAVYESGLLRREQLFLQTKFTSIRGQDERLPYDPQAPVANQVAQSFAKSQEHLGTNYIDSLILHGPTTGHGLHAADWEAWYAMEAIYHAGQAKMLGISNVNAQQLETLCKQVQVPPTFVQNRCYAVMGWDREVRAVCKRYGIIYQGFSLLTANPAAVRSPQVQQLASKYQTTEPVIVFRLALDLGMIPLTGTCSSEHMQKDLTVFGFELMKAEVAQLEVAFV